MVGKEGIAPSVLAVNRADLQSAGIATIRLARFVVSTFTVGFHIPPGSLTSYHQTVLGILRETLVRVRGIEPP